MLGISGFTRMRNKPVTKATEERTVVQEAPKLTARVEERTDQKRKEDAIVRKEISALETATSAAKKDVVLWSGLSAMLCYMTAASAVAGDVAYAAISGAWAVSLAWVAAATYRGMKKTHALAQRVSEGKKTIEQLRAEEKNPVQRDCEEQKAAASNARTGAVVWGVLGGTMAYLAATSAVAGNAVGVVTNSIWVVALARYVAFSYSNMKKSQALAQRVSEEKKTVTQLRAEEINPLQKDYEEQSAAIRREGISTAQWVGLGALNGYLAISSAAAGNVPGAIISTVWTAAMVQFASTAYANMQKAREAAKALYAKISVHDVDAPEGEKGISV